jgi:hypothetical protein
MSEPIKVDLYWVCFWLALIALTSKGPNYSDELTRIAVALENQARAEPSGHQ